MQYEQHLKEDLKTFEYSFFQKTYKWIFECLIDNGIAFEEGRIYLDVFNMFSYTVCYLHFLRYKAIKHNLLFSRNLSYHSETKQTLYI